MVLPRGTRVRMTQSLKGALAANDCADHVAEFGNCVGVVEDAVEWAPQHVGPEVNVRWTPSGLRYAYHPDDLELV